MKSCHLFRPPGASDCFLELGLVGVLAGKGIEFIGNDTGGKVHVRIKQDDGAIEFVKQGPEYAAHRGS